MDNILPIPVAARSKPWVCDRALGGIAGSNPPADKVVPLVSVTCCHVEVSASSWSLVQMSLIECGVSQCDREALIMRGPWPIRSFRHMEKLYNVLDRSNTHHSIQIHARR